MDPNLIPTFVKNLNAKQSRFVDEYLIDGNATQAAIRAGYSKKSAHSLGPRLLDNVDVQAGIAHHRARLAAKTHLTAERVQQEIARIAFADVRKLYDDEGVLLNPKQWDDDTAAAVAGVDVEELFAGKGENREHVGTTSKVKLWDKGRALQLAAQVTKIIGDSVNVNVAIGLRLEIHL